MQGAGPGTLLGGRYDLRNRLSQGRDLECWSANDTTLEREVNLTIVGSDHPNRAGVLDAARRAAGVEDARLVRILDVGNHEGNSFIVEESMGGSESLAEILRQGPLPAEEARRVAGETARGLDRAGRRGLHHLLLTPDSVLISPDGAIRVSGVAVAAAINGPGEPDGDTASRRDTVCLVAVVYAALTGRWPLDEQISGFEQAPRVVDGVAAPSEIAAGVPTDLDTLCRLTLNEGSGPVTPGEFANQIAPWSREPIHRDGIETTAVLQPFSSGEVADDIPAPARETEPTVAIPTRDFSAQPTSTRSADGVPEPTRSQESAGATVGDTDVRADRDAVGGHLLSPNRLMGQYDGGGPPLPMLPASTALTPSRGQTKIVVLVVAAFVTLSLFVGYCGLSGPIGDTTGSSSAPKRTVAVSEPPVTAPSSPPPATTTTAPTQAQPVAILSATGFDPEGDQSEKNSQAGRVYDGDLATTWTSEGYGSAELGGLKEGAGVLLDLGQPTSVRQVTIDLGGEPVDFTVFAATESSIDGAAVVGTAKSASGRVQLKAASTLPKAQYIIVWFTRLAQDGDRFRASIAEIALT